MENFTQTPKIGIKRCTRMLRVCIETTWLELLLMLASGDIETAAIMQPVWRHCQLMRIGRCCRKVARSPEPDQAISTSGSPRATRRTRRRLVPVYVGRPGLRESRLSNDSPLWSQEKLSARRMRIKEEARSETEWRLVTHAGRQASADAYCKCSLSVSNTPRVNANLWWFLDAQNCCRQIL